MNWQQIFNRLTRAERQEITQLLLQRIQRPRRSRLSGLRPIHILYPAVFAQVILFVGVMARPVDNFFGWFITGNLVIAALSILPSAFIPPRPLVHWVRPAN